MTDANTWEVASFKGIQVRDVIKCHKGIKSYQDAVFGIVSEIKIACEIEIIIQKCGTHFFNVVLTIYFTLFLLQGT